MKKIIKKNFINDFHIFFKIKNNLILIKYRIFKIKNVKHQISFQLHILLTFLNTFHFNIHFFHVNVTISLKLILQVFLQRHINLILQNRKE